MYKFSHSSKLVLWPKPLLLRNYNLISGEVHLQAIFKDVFIESRQTRKKIYRSEAGAGVNVLPGFWDLYNQRSRPTVKEQAEVKNSAHKKG